MLYDLLFIILTFHLIIIIHEMGHFLMARAFGVQVTQVAIGFGKTLYSTTSKSGIIWRLAACPFGGYVTLLDYNENEAHPAQARVAFNTQSTWKQICIYLAGPAANLLCAVMLFTLIFSVGMYAVRPVIQTIIPHSIAAQSTLKPASEIIAVNQHPTSDWQDVVMQLIGQMGQAKNIAITTIHNHQVDTHTLDIEKWSIQQMDFDPLESLGIRPYRPPIPVIVDRITPNSPASKVLQVGDTIRAINDIPLTDFQQFKQAMQPVANQVINLTIERNQQQITLPIQAEARFGHGWQRVGYLGIAPPKTPWDPNMLRFNQFPPYQAVVFAFKSTADMLNFNLIILYKLITRTIPLAVLSGPLAFMNLAVTALNKGWLSFLRTCAIINILLAFVNLLPIPGLDGGNIIFRLYECARGRPIHRLWQQLITTLCAIFLVVLTIHATINDVLRLLGTS